MNTRRLGYGERSGCANIRRFALAALLLVVGCAPGEPPPEGRTVTDDLGRTVTLPARPARLVSLAPNLTELVFAAGAGDRLVGVGTADDYPAAVAEIPRVSVFPLDFEAVAARAPDLVLATDQVNSPQAAETFAALRLPIYFFTFSRLGDVVRNLRTLGDLLGTREAAEASAAALEARLDSLRARTAGRPDAPEVLFLIGDDVLYSFGSESYIHDVIAVAGGRSVMEDVEAVAPVLSDEYVLTHPPDVIVGPWGEAYDPAVLLRHHPTWDVLPAVRNGRVYGVDPDLFFRPGPRLVDAAERLSALLNF